MKGMAAHSNVLAWRILFNPFTFKVIIDKYKYDPIAIYFIVLGSGLYALFMFPF